MDYSANSTAATVSIQQIINGSAVTMNFSDKPSGSLIDQLTDNLMSSYVSGIAKSGRVHLDNKI